jgi:IclR family pca regulon transcriptional regulator
MSNMSSEKLNKDFVGSLEKGLKVICAFDKDNNELTLTDVAKLTDMTRATARRFLKTLEVLGYVNSDGRLFSLSPKILELGFAYLTSEPIVNIVQTFIEQISEQTGESSSVSVLDGNDIVYIARHSVNHIMSVSLNIGSRLPALSTSMGRVLTAYLPEQLKQEMLEQITFTAKTSKTITDANILSVELDKIKQQGYCIVDRELDNSLISIAVPLVNNQGKIVAAINIGASYSRMNNEKKLKEVITILKKAASEIKLFLH